MFQDTELVHRAINNLVKANCGEDSDVTSTYIARGDNAPRVDVYYTPGHGSGPSPITALEHNLVAVFGQYDKMHPHQLESKDVSNGVSISGSIDVLIQKVQQAMLTGPDDLKARLAGSEHETAVKKSSRRTPRPRKSHTEEAVGRQRGLFERGE